MNWFFKLVLLGAACSAVLIEEDLSSESPAFPKLEVIESVFKRSFENALYTESLDGDNTHSKDDKPKEMPQDVLSYLGHGYHPGNADVWKLHRVWKAMETVARHLPQIVSSNKEPTTKAKIRNLCERHAREQFGVDFEKLDCDPDQEYRVINGTCNNLNNTRWGSAAQPFERFLMADYGGIGDGCTSPWVSIGSMEGCFLFNQDHMNWDNARSYCQRNGEDLASLDTESKRKYMIKYMESRGLMNGHSRHLGANDRSGSWRWVSGQSVTNGWRIIGGEPHNDQGNDTCMYLYTDPYPSGRYDLLSDYKCTIERYFICEKGAATTKPTTTGNNYIGPFDNIWNADQCGHIKYHDGVTSLSVCKDRCSQKDNCNVFNYNQHKQRCRLMECPVPIPAPLSSNKYEGYALISGSWSGPFDNVWNDDQCGYIGGSVGGGGFSLSGCQSLCLQKPNCTAVNWNPQITRCETRICPVPLPAPNWKRGYCGYSLSSGGPSLRRSKNDEELPNPRKISQALSNSEPREQPKVSLMLMQWGQFLDHDITLTPEREHEEEVDGSKAIMCCNEGKLKNSVSLLEDCVPIDVSEDPYYQMDDRQCIRFVRSMPVTQGCAHTPMEQINRITAFVDGSMIYGSDLVVADSLRTKSRGLLNTTTHEGNDQPLPPRGSPTNNSPLRCPQAESMNSCFLAGDVRVDEIPGLTAMHTTFIRLHNIIAKELVVLNPHWTYDDEKLYQETRRIVIALIQQTTYRDWLPHVVGPTLMEEHHLETGKFGYRDSYNPNVNPTIRNVFATAAFRFGHSLIAEVIKAATPASDLPLPGHFFDISTIKSNGRSPSSLLKGLTRCPAQPIDTVVEKAFTNSLFAEKPADDGNFYGLDMVSLNIQRGRDHGIPSYREWRKFCGLDNITEFEDLKKVMPEDLAETFNQTYHDVDDIDLFPAGLAENSIGDGILGPTFSCIIAHQFAKIKHGDRFWYERKDQPKQFTPEQLSSIRSQGLVSILCRVSEHTTFNFQPDPFLVADDYGNKVMSCSSYNFINLQPWKEH